MNVALDQVEITNVYLMRLTIALRNTIGNFIPEIAEIQFHILQPAQLQIHD